MPAAARPSDAAVNCAAKPPKSTACHFSRRKKGWEREISDAVGFSVA